MLRRIEQWLVVTLLVVLIGGHWAILQSAAWVGMLVNYSNTTTLSEAWTKTFDGKHPCKMCKLVREGKKSERKQDLLKMEAKFDFTFDARACGLFPPRPFRHFRPVAEQAEARADAPLLRPPIAA